MRPASTSMRRTTSLMAGSKSSDPSGFSTTYTSLAPVNSTSRTHTQISSVFVHDVQPDDVEHVILAFRERVDLVAAHLQERAAQRLGCVRVIDAFQLDDDEALMKSRSLHGPLLRRGLVPAAHEHPRQPLKPPGKSVKGSTRTSPCTPCGAVTSPMETNSSMHPSTRQSTISTCTSRPSRTALAFTSVRSAGDPASPADNSPQIVCVYVQFEHQRALAYHFVHVHGIRVLHQMPRHVLEQISHGTLPFPSLRRLELLPHARLAQQISGRVGRLSAFSQPLQGLLLVHGDLRGIGDGVVSGPAGR